MTEPYPDLVWAWIGFWRLSNTRPQGMGGPLRIPMSEIESYSNIMDWSYQKTQEFLFYIEHLDTAFMTYMAERQEEEKNKKPGNK